MKSQRVRSHVGEVKSYFDTSDYLRRREFDIRIRAETVQDLTREGFFRHILDIGCGNGAISLPLLTKCVDLTLLDISTSMLSLAKDNTKAEFLSKVRLVNDDIMHAPLDPQYFDLVLCIGVLAHVDLRAK